MSFGQRSIDGSDHGSDSGDAKEDLGHDHAAQTAEMDGGTAGFGAIIVPAGGGGGAGAGVGAAARSPAEGFAAGAIESGSGSASDDTHDGFTLAGATGRRGQATPPIAMPDVRGRSHTTGSPVRTRRSGHGGAAASAGDLPPQSTAAVPAARAASDDGTGRRLQKKGSVRCCGG